MPKLVTTVLRGQIALITPILQKMDIKTQRLMQDRLGRLGAQALKGRVRYDDEHFDSFLSAWALPEGAEMPRKAILYLHGGAYTAGSLDYAKGFGGILCQETGRAVLCVGYRLAPESPYPAAIEDALDAYKLLLKTYAPEDIAFAGESAGGGLCFCLLLKCKALGLPLPEKVVAISPWADLSMEKTRHADNEADDPVLNAEGLMGSAFAYAGDHLYDPFVSPVYGDLTGLPPSLMFCGTHDILVSDMRTLRDKLLSSGCACEAVEEEGLWHVYVLYGVPEAREAIERIVRFLKEADE